MTLIPTKLAVQRGRQWKSKEGDKRYKLWWGLPREQMPSQKLKRWGKYFRWRGVETSPWEGGIKARTKIQVMTQGTQDPGALQFLVQDGTWPVRGRARSKWLDRKRRKGKKDYWSSQGQITPGLGGQVKEFRFYCRCNGKLLKDNKQGRHKS